MFRVIAFILAFGVFGGAGAAEVEFASGDHCVAWKTKKTMFLLRSLEPVGKNCKITTAMNQVEEGKYRFQGNFPLASFDSGEKERDTAVLELLGADQQSDLIFRSQVMSQEKWRELLSAGEGSIEGALNIAGKDFPLKLTMKAEAIEDGYVFRGEILTDYRSLSLKPPQVVGGVVASVKEHLELHFHFQSSQVENMEVFTR